MAEPSKFLRAQLRALKHDKGNLELAHDVGVQAVSEGFDVFGRALMRTRNAEDVGWELRHLPWERVKVFSNYHWRDFLVAAAVPDDVLANEFDYQDEDVIDGFFYYRNTWYHLDQFMNAPAGAFPGDYWHGYLNDSMSTGVVIRISDDGEQYQVGYFVG